MTVTDYERALGAEPQLRAVEAAVDALCALVRPGDTFCYGCVWERIVKPLALPLVGWSRSPGSVMRQTATDTDAWLRTSAAYDAVTDVWLQRLETADPGNGHGIIRHHRREGRP